MVAVTQFSSQAVDPHRMQTLCWFLPSIQSDNMATDPYFFIEFSPVHSPVQSPVQSRFQVL